METEIQIIEKKAKPAPKGKLVKPAKPKFKGIKPNPFDAYAELQAEIRKLAARKVKKGKVEKLTEAEANAKVKAIEKVLKANDFKPVGKDTGLFYDGTTFARVTCTTTEPVKGSWVVTAGITTSQLGVSDLRFSFGIPEYSGKAPVKADPKPKAKKKAKV